jgi:undecaprenyl diphosphate synthase
MTDELKALALSNTTSHEESSYMGAHEGPQYMGAEKLVDELAATPRKRGWSEEYGIKHIAIIPDGNRRWASERSVPIEVGHSEGLLTVLPELVDKLSAAGVHTITVWGFSTENWTREASEVSHLMSICVYFLMNRLLEIAQRHGGRLIHIGRKDRISNEVRVAIEHVEQATAQNRNHVYNMAFDYGGRDELTRACERMFQALRTGTPESELRIEDFLDTTHQPNPEPDIVIRSSGEQRMSGFMPWQTAYSEIFFVEQYFPDFNFALIQRVAEQFRARKRRFGS